MDIHTDMMDTETLVLTEEIVEIRVETVDVLGVLDVAVEINLQKPHGGRVSLKSSILNSVRMLFFCLRQFLIRNRPQHSDFDFLSQGCGLRLVCVMTFQ
jgi:hypothetical protein